MWAQVEAMPVRSGVRRVWLELFGELGIASLAPFLKVTGKTATAYPCGGSELGCVRRVVVHDFDDISAVCGSEDGACETLAVGKEELSVLDFDHLKLGSYLAAALGLSGQVQPFLGRHEVTSIGALVPRAGTAYPAFLVFEDRGSRSMEDSYDAIVARHPGRLIMLTPTSGSVSASMRERAATARHVLAPLAQLLVPGANGFSLGDGADTLFAPLFPDAVTKPPAPRFPTPAGVRWSDVGIYFVNEEDVAISVAKVNVRANCGSLGLNDGRAPKPSKRWRLLRRLAENRGVFPSLGPAEVKQSQLLATFLRDYFGIEGDPFERRPGGGLERTRFNVRD